jgi:acyl carrier protein
LTISSIHLAASQKLLSILKLPVDLDTTLPFEDLGLDSLDVIEVAQTLIDVRGVVFISDPEIGSVQSLDDLLFLFIQSGGNLTSLVTLAE